MAVDLGLELRSSEELIAQLEALIVTTPPTAWDTCRDGEWSARQILAHLVDTELAFGFRLRVAIANSGGSISPFDQDQWAVNLPYGSIPIEVLVVAFTSGRRVNVGLLSAIPDATWEQTVLHPVNGEMTLRQVASVFLPHGAEHVTQLQGMLSNG